MSGSATQRRTRDGIAGVKINEIEPGRAVPNIWENQLVEPWRSGRLGSRPNAAIASHSKGKQHDHRLSALLA